MLCRCFDRVRREGGLWIVAVGDRLGFFFYLLRFFLFLGNIDVVFRLWRRF